MSDPTADAQIIEELQVQQIEIFLIWSVTALVTYEYVITIHNEITMVWRKKWTIATWLFILNRYLLIAYTLLTVVPYSAQVGARLCRGTEQFSNLVNLAQFIVFALFSALRAFVIYNFNIPILVLVFLLNIVPVATNIYSDVRSTVVYVDGICTDSLNIPANINFDLAILTGLAMIAGDIVVLIVTWITTYKPLREARELKISNTLGGVFLRDGTLYFIALLTLNIAQICFQNIPSIQNSSASPVVIYVQVLTPILISRFLLNLRETNDRGVNPQEISLSQFSVPEFHRPAVARSVGAMGEALDHSVLFAQEEDAEEASYTPTPPSVTVSAHSESAIERTHQISHGAVV